jgi:hypothetical protein
VSDRVLRFPDRIWDELEGLPQPLRNTAHRTIFHLLEEPVPTLADPFPDVDPPSHRVAAPRFLGSGRCGGGASRLGWCYSASCQNGRAADRGTLGGGACRLVASAGGDKGEQDIDAGSTHLTDRVTRRLPGRSGAAKNQIFTSAGLIHMNLPSAPNGGSWVPHRLCRHRP